MFLYCNLLLKVHPSFIIHPSSQPSIHRPPSSSSSSSSFSLSYESMYFNPPEKICLHCQVNMASWMFLLAFRGAKDRQTPGCQRIEGPPSPSPLLKHCFTHSNMRCSLCLPIFTIEINQSCRKMYHALNVWYVWVHLEPTLLEPEVHSFRSQTVRHQI